VSRSARRRVPARRQGALPAHEWHDAACDNKTVELPSFEEVTADKVAFANATRLLHHETNPQNGRRLVQKHGDRLLVVNPPHSPSTRSGMDRVYDLPYTRKPHPRYRNRSLRTR
jgi:radical SAM superfamily enzyme YgiQ (UPF0313 family)